MKIKTSKLTGAALDRAVAKCEGRESQFNMESHGRTWRGWWLVNGGEYTPMPSYSTDWAQGGPIIEREGIEISPNGPYVNGRIVPDSWCTKIDEVTDYIEGPTPLIAAMRAYIASKLGDEVEVPDDFTQ